MPNRQPDDPLSVAAAAEELHRSPRTVLHWIQTGKVQATKLGPGTAAYIIRRSELDRIKADELAA